MAEFIYTPVQTVSAGSPIALNTAIPCNKGYIYHRNGSGIVTLRGIVNCQSACYARYRVEFSGNIAIPEGGTVGPISVAVTLDGETLESSRAITTPTAAEAFYNVTSAAMIIVPKGCCFNVSIDNTSNQAIDVQNANLSVTRIA